MTMVALSLLMALALISYHQQDVSFSHLATDNPVANLAGHVGAWLADCLLYFFGVMAYFFPLSLFFLGLCVIYRSSDQDAWAPPWWLLMLFRCVGALLFVSGGCGLCASLLPSWVRHMPDGPGGVLGQVWVIGMDAAFGTLGGQLVLCACLLLGFTLATGFSWVRVCRVLKNGVVVVVHAVWRSCCAQKNFLMAQAAKRKQQTLQSESCEPAQVVPLIQKSRPVKVTVPQLNPVLQMRSPRKNPNAQSEMPTLDLLDCPANRDHLQVNEALLLEKSLQLEAHLRDFSVEVKVVGVLPGPVVTRYELALAPGTKVSKVSGLAKDLARSLSMTSVRVVEVIPGKSVIGIELPNDQREMVGLQEILVSDSFQQSGSALTVALGKDISGHPMIADLAKMPHLLVAGTTGSGKSVGLNAMLISLLYKSTPQQLRLIMIDPKMLELAVYEGIPHLLTPVVTDMKDAAMALRWSVVEMERRYRLMAALGVRNLAGYNVKISEAEASGEPIRDPLYLQETPSDRMAAPILEKMPQIVILADEFADMMVVVGKKVEILIARLAQKARAAGIHLILATQRPSVDVITGLIKANIPTRIAFQVSSKVDSRTILDQQGADQLLGHGDMLYLPPGAGVPIRIHGAFVSDDEVHRVVEHLKSQSAPDYLEEVLEATTVDPSGFTDGLLSDPEGGHPGSEQDVLFDETVEFITQARKVSISSIQRRFKIGYNRAARMVDALETAGVIGPQEGSSPREVLAPPPPK